MLKPRLAGRRQPGGLLRFQNQDLVDGRNLIGQMASAIAGVVNQQQMLGVNLQQPGRQRAVASRCSRSATRSRSPPPPTRRAAPAPMPPASPRPTDRAAGGDYARPTRRQRPVRADAAVADGWRAWPTATWSTACASTSPGTPAQAGDHFLLAGGRRRGHATALLPGPARPGGGASPLVATMDRPTPAPPRYFHEDGESPPQPRGTARITFTDDNGGYTWDPLDASGNAGLQRRRHLDGRQPIPCAAGGHQRLLDPAFGRAAHRRRAGPRQTCPDFIGSNNGNALLASCAT